MPRAASIKEAVAERDLHFIIIIINCSNKNNNNNNNNNKQMKKKTKIIYINRSFYARAYINVCAFLLLLLLLLDCDNVDVLLLQRCLDESGECILQNVFSRCFLLAAAKRKESLRLPSRSFSFTFFLIVFFTHSTHSMRVYDMNVHIVIAKEMFTLYFTFFFFLFAHAYS